MPPEPRFCVIVARSGPRQRGDRGQDFLLFRMPTFYVLAEDHLPVDIDVEDATPARDEFDRLDWMGRIDGATKSRDDGVRQTGGSGCVASFGAEDDADAHDYKYAGPRSPLAFP